MLTCLAQLGITKLEKHEQLKWISSQSFVYPLSFLHFNLYTVQFSNLKCNYQLDHSFLHGPFQWDSPKRKLFFFFNIYHDILTLSVLEFHISGSLRSVIITFLNHDYIINTNLLKSHDILGWALQIYYVLWPNSGFPVHIVIKSGSLLLQLNDSE
jgi:hypothetical protein